MANTVPLRSDVPIEHTWNTDSIFPTPDAWEAAFKQVESSLPSLEAFKGRLASDAKTLADWLETSEKVQITLNQVSVYARLNYTVDTTNQASVARQDRSRGLASRHGAATAFARPEMLAIGKERLDQWIKQEPRLARYGHFFDRMERRRPHVRSAEVEQLLSSASDAFTSGTSTHGILTDAELKVPPVRTPSGETFDITSGTINKLLHHPDRETRRMAWEQYSDAHLAVKQTLGNVVATGVKQNVFFARARSYGSPLEAALLPNFVPPEVFHNLIGTFRKNLPTWHRYWRLIRTALGYDKLHVHDLKAPLGASQPEVPYATAVDWITEGMRPLGEEYVREARRGMLEERWVDIYPNKGKRAGAFSSGAYGTNPFVLMSYNDDVFSASTLAHEIGHSMHSWYTRRTQPFVYSGYGLFLAEVASNFNQAMVRAHLLRTNDDRDFQIAVLEEAFANFHRYFFVMPTLARFELAIHDRAWRGEAITAQTLMTVLTDLFREGYGDEVEIDADRIGITWAYFSTHLYSNFYEYQYATGIAGAHALAEGILAGKPRAAEKYVEFLKAGGSDYPLETLRRAGVDLASPEPVEQTFGVLARMVDRLEALVRKARMTKPE
jgi:oligoendopeptidase F